MAMLQHHKGKVPYSIYKQLTPCVLDAECKWVKDILVEKRCFKPIKTDHSEFLFI